MSRFDDGVAGVDEPFLAACVCTPQHEYEWLIALAENLDDPIGEGLPTTFLV